MSRQLNVVIVALSLALVMTQFQNCAGPQNYTNNNGTVHLIEGSGMYFATPDAHVSEAATSVQLSGICDRSHNGQSYNWSVTVASGGASVASGNGVCAGGQFSLDVTTSQNVVCGVPYLVNVTNSWGGSAQMTVDKLCEPLASADLGNAAADNGQPQSCQLEYRTTSDGSDQGLCQAVCFRNNIMSSLEERPLDDCENLIMQISRR